MTNQTAEHYRNRIRIQIDAMQSKLADLKAAEETLKNTAYLQFLDEDRIVKLVGGQPVVTQTSAPVVSYKQPNRGLRANIIRYLMGGPSTESDLFGVVTCTDRSAIVSAIGSCVKDGLITEHGSTLALTESGREKGQWLLMNPGAKLYAAYKDKKS